MGKKITELNEGVIPYTGTEEVALVDEAQTRRASLSSIANYLSGASYQTAPGEPIDKPIASPLRNNFFKCDQSIGGNLSANGSLIVAAGGSIAIGVLQVHVVILVVVVLTALLLRIQ